MTPVNETAADRTTTLRRRLILAALALLGILLYVNTLRHPPVWDDHTSVFGQPFLSDGANLWKVLDPRSLYRILPVRNCARPVWLASVLLDANFSDGTVLVYRLSSLFWHLLGAFLVVLIAFELGRNETAAALAGTLFLVHPVHTEAVNIITFRAVLLSFDFSAFAAYFYLAARDRDGRWRRALFAASWLAFGLGLLSMEMAATLPLLLLAAEALFPARASAAASWRRDRRVVYAGYAVVLILYLFFRLPRSGYPIRGGADVFSAWRDAHPGVVDYWARGGTVSQQAPMDPRPWSGPYDASAWVRFLTMSKIFGSYLRLLVWPHPLQGDYAPVPVTSPSDPGVWASWAAWLALAIAAWVNRKKRPLAAFGALAVFICLLPVSGVITLKNLKAERYVYFASAGLCLSAGALFAEWSGRGSRGRRACALGTFGALVVIGSALTVRRNRDYRDDFTFYRATELVDDHVPRVHLNLAQDYVYRNRPADAEREFRAGLELWPDSVRGRLLFADFLSAQGRAEEARAQIDEALKRAPGDTALLQARVALARGGGRPTP